jgi:hypothetical protein
MERIILEMETTSTQVNQSGSLDNIPLLVLTTTKHDTPPEQEELWQDWQIDLTALSTNSLHKVVQGADHASFWLDGETAKVSIASILQVIVAARAGQILTLK